MKKYFLLFVLIILSSCNSNDDENSTKKADAQAEKDLQGRWNWVSTTSGVDGTIKTAASANTTIVIEFSGSNFKKYTNGVLTMDTTFKVVTQQLNEDGPLQTIVTGGYMPINNVSGIVSDTSHEGFKIVNNKLLMNHFCNKCSNSEYVRAQEVF
ncbi:hypothetical protein D3C85_649520 [compost metagenome]